MAYHVSVSYDNQIAAELMHRHDCVFPPPQPEERPRPKVLGAMFTDGPSGAFLFLQFVGHRNPADDGLTVYHVAADSQKEALRQATAIYLSIKDGLDFHKHLDLRPLVPGGYLDYLRSTGLSDTEMAAQLPKAPRVFVTYAFEDDAQHEWIRRFAARLRRDYVDVQLDQWQLVPGDQLPQFMETAIRESQFVLMLCTPTFKAKADSRKGGVGFEGGIITGELFTQENHRKFIPILRRGTWVEAAPSFAMGQLHVDLRGDPYSEANYVRLLEALYGHLPTPPPLGTALGMS